MSKIPKNSYAVIMAGGSGTRLWPLSRRDLPKQIQSFIGDKTLINETVERLLGVMDRKRIYVSTTINYGPKIKKLLPEIPEENIIIEPASRGTTAAFALVIMTIMMRDPEAVVFTIASDHSVTNVEQLHESIYKAFDHVSENPKDIALIGIKPTRPDTGLGYIKTKGILNEEKNIHIVEKFMEKPARELAESYVASGDYYWNTAYYCFKAETLLNAYKDADPEINETVGRYLSSGDISHFMKAPLKNHEIEIIDSSKHRLVMVTGDFNWRDIGSWQGLHEVLSAANGQNLVSNSEMHVDVNSKDCLVLSNGKKLIATVNLDNIVIVDTDDALLVMNKNNSQDVKELTEILKKKGMTDFL
ncbi:MAG TPA: sugar phosphate nucleotidyltransferase [Candidatus Paceibacterota bacterium]|nr:sugar phosphate nucleotidyltransferase [Candidatus Paceibacterota bacterium]